MGKHDSKAPEPAKGGKGGKHAAPSGGKHAEKNRSGSVGNTDNSKRGRGLIDPDRDADRR